jgi:hypothetical protein
LRTFAATTFAVILVVSVTLSVVATAVYLGQPSRPNTTTKTITSTTTTSISTTINASDDVSLAFANHMMLIPSMNVSALVNGYEHNATVVWKGTIGAMCSCSYLNGTNLSVDWNLLFQGPSDTNFFLGNETYYVVPVGTTYVVNSNFDFQASNSLFGRINGTVSAQDSYVHVGSTWLISNEAWNFTSFEVQYPVIAG